MTALHGSGRAGADGTALSGQLGGWVLPDDPRTYGNWRTPSTPGLPGLGLLGTVAALGGVVLVVLVQMIAGLLPALVVLLGVAAGVLPLLYRDRGGRNGWQVAGARGLWAVGRRRGHVLYRSGALAPGTDTVPAPPPPPLRSPAGLTEPATGSRPAGGRGRHTLPGLLAASQVLEAVDSYGRPFVLLHVPSTRHYSVVLRCEPEGGALVDPDTSDTWVARWGRWLAELSREPNLVAASATVETAPDPGSRLAREVDQLTGSSAPPLAQQVLDQIAGSYALGSPQVTGRVSLTWDATRRTTDDTTATTNLPLDELLLAPEATSKRRRRRRSPVMSPAEVAAQVASRLPGLIAELAATGAGGVRALTAVELAETVRVAYDPAAGPVLEALHARGADSGITWVDAGPAATVEDWAALRHDSGSSITWQMTGAPRGAVQAQVLRALLEPHADLVRKRVTLLYRPHDPASSARIADADVRTALGRATVRKGETRAAETLDLAAARQTAAEEASGAGLTRFALLVTATVTDPAQLAHAADLIDQAAGASRLQLRRAYASQSASFAAALGIGLVLHRHVAVPAVLRQYL